MQEQCVWRRPLGLTSAEWELVQQAAAVTGTTPFRFMRDAARCQAQHVLGQCLHLETAPLAMQQFMEALDAPIAGNTVIQTLLSSASPWDTVRDSSD